MISNGCGPVPQTQEICVQFELNDMQLSFWRVWRGFKDRPLNHRSMKIEWRVALDVDTFKLAAQDLVDSTDALRLRFVERYGTPYQYAAETCDPSLIVRDFSGHDCPADAAVDWLSGLETAPFDLEIKAFSMALAKVADDHWIWLLNQHHVITDFTSSTHLIKRLSYFYDCRRDAVTSDVSQYPPFLDYHQRHVASQSRIAFDGQRPARLHPALAHDAPQLVQPKAYKQSEFHLGRDRLQRFRTARGLSKNSEGARFHGALYELVLATTFAFIYRVSGQSGTTIGTMSHGRFTPDSTEVIGPLVRVLPLSLEIEGGWSCSDLLSGVQSGRKNVFRAVKLGKHIQGAPFNASVNFIPETMPEFSGVRSREITKFRPTEDISRDLSITVRAADTPGDVKCLFNTSQDVADVVKIDTLQSIFLCIFDAFVDNPACAIDDIPIFSKTDVAKELTRSAGAVNVPVLPYLSLVEGVLKQARITPTATAVIAGKTSLTFQELEQKSRHAAAALLARGIGVGHVVALQLPRTEQLIITLLGVLRAGATFFALDTRQPAQRRAFMVTDSDAKVLILPQGEDVMTSDINLPTVDPLQLIEDGKSLDIDLPEIDPAGVMYIMYTSGTTGTPKGVQVPHHSFARYHHWACDALSGGKPINWALATTMSFETAFRAFMPLTTGGAVVAYQSPDDVAGMSVVAAFADDQVDGIALTPSQLSSLCDRKWQLDRLQILVIIGETFPTELALRARKAFGPAVKLYNLYGPTEATMASTLHRFDAHFDRDETVPIGTAAQGSAIHILDAQLQPVPDGLIGEICIAGTRLSKGYLNRGDLTVQSFLPDPFRNGGLIYRTGDLGRYARNGALVHHGRLDDQVKINGVRVELAEIEIAVTRHTDVTNCAVVMKKRGADNHPAHHLIAFYTSDRDIPVSELRVCCAAGLARDIIPQVFVRVSAIPLAHNGKTDRLGLLARVPQTLPERPETGATKTGPTGLTEQKISSIWYRVLKVEAVSRSDSFFEVGGDSLSFLQMILMVEAELSVSLTAMALDGVVTVAQLGRLVETLIMAEGPHQKKPASVAKLVPKLASTGTPLAEVRRQLFLGSVAWSGGQIGTNFPVFHYNTSGTKPPLFWCFNGAKEPVVMAQELGIDQPLYALRSLQSVIEHAHKADYLDAIATGYVDEITTLQPAGPYYIGGNCQSGKIAEHIARELLARGHHVGHVFLLEHAPQSALDVGVSLFFGRDSQDYNPFLTHERPDLEWNALFPTVTWDIVPGHHGQYFQPRIAPAFVGRLSDRLKTAQDSINLTVEAV